jgi:hypothetical protein
MLAPKGEAAARRGSLSNLPGVAHIQADVVNREAATRCGHGSRWREIDDNQVQSLRVSWLDPGDPRVRFRLAFEAISPDEYRPREKLFLLEFSPERCFPILVGESRQRDRRHVDLRPRQPFRSGRRAGRADRRGPPARYGGRVVTSMAALTAGMNRPGATAARETEPTPEDIRMLANDAPPRKTS